MINLNEYKAPFAVVASNAATAERLADVISEAEERYLRQILGDEYSDFVENPTEQKWIDFVKGVNYEFRGETYTYSGIKEPLKLLIFKDLQDDLRFNVSNHGYQKLNYDTGMQIYPKQKIVFAWNKGAEIINTEVSLYLYRIESITFKNFEYLNEWI